LLVQKSGAAEVSKINGSILDGIRTTAHFTGSNPAALGAADAGTSEFMSRGDHVHPSAPASAREANLGSASLPWYLVYVSSTSGNLGILHGAACYTTASDGWKFRLCDTNGDLTPGGDVPVSVPITCAGITCHTITPASHNTYDLGTSDNKWDDVYATNGTIQTSDERQKEDISDSDLGLDFVNALHPIKFRWRVAGYLPSEAKDADGQPIMTPRPGVRFHYGLQADEVKAAAGEKDFGGYVEDVVTGHKGLRYSQFIAPLVKAVQELHGQVQAERQARQALEQRLAVLEKALGPIGGSRAKA
jgi:hypothetical protein